MPKIQNVKVKKKLNRWEIERFKISYDHKNFCRIKIKMYTYITKDEHESKKAKGINNSVTADELKYENHKNVFFNVTYINHEMNNRSQSQNRNIGTP